MATLSPPDDDDDEDCICEAPFPSFASNNVVFIIIIAGKLDAII